MTKLKPDGDCSKRPQRKQHITKRYCTTLSGFIFVIAVLVIFSSCQNRHREQNKDNAHKIKSTESASHSDSVVQKAATPATAIAAAPGFNGDPALLRVQAVKWTPTKENTYWGYEIYARDSLLIRQLSVPAVAGKNGFKSAADAEKIGEMVLRKLKNHQIPSITLEELRKANVHYAAF